MLALAKSPPTRNEQSRTINVRVPISVFNQLDELANATSRTKSFVTVEALSKYLEVHSWQVRDVEAGIVDADNGDFATETQVNTIFAKYDA